MTFSHLPRNAAFTLSFAVLVFCFLALSDSAEGSAATRAAILGEDNALSLAEGQSSSKTNPTGQSRKQKLANPLNDLLDEAQRHIDKNEFESAITPLQKVLAEQPDFAYAHFQLAYVYTALKRLDEARVEYERTIALDPKMGEAYLNLGLLFLQSDPPGAQPQFARAVAPLRKAVELMPGQKEPLRTLAIAQQHSGDEAGAEESFRALLRLDPDNSEANMQLALSLMRKSKPQEAEAYFRSAANNEKPNLQALKGLAESLEAQKKSEDAIDAYRKYIGAKGFTQNDTDARVRLVHLLVAGQQYDAALAELDRVPPETVVTQSPIPPLEFLKLRADIQIAQKKWADAITTLQKAIALAPNDEQLHGGLGRTYLQLRDFANAEKQLKTAIKLDARNIEYWKDLSSTYYLSKNYAAALAVLDRIDKMETPAAGSWFIRALCYDSLNQPKPALEAYQKFLELEQNKESNQFWQAQERSKVLRRMLEGKK